MHAVIAVGIALLIQGQREPFRLKGPGSEIDIWNSHLSLELIPTGTRAEVKGSPAQIAVREAGMAFFGNSITADLATDEKGRGYVSNAAFTDSARLVFDFNSMMDFLREIGGPIEDFPPGTPNPAHAEFTAARFSYDGTYETGTLHFPVPFDLTANGASLDKVKKGDALLDRQSTYVFRMHGVSGDLGVFVKADPKTLPLRTGTLNGPVTLHARRESTLGGQPELPGEINATADRMEYDFVSAVHTVSLTGNVKLDGLHQTYAGSSTGARVVLTFGADNQVKKVEIEQAETNLKPQPKPGGGAR
jgi:hypothetical protein